MHNETQRYSFTIDFIVQAPSDELNREERVIAFEERELVIQDVIHRITAMIEAQTNLYDMLESHGIDLRIVGTTR